MIKFIAKNIWYLSEFFGIGLGRFAPFIFGLMIGRQGKRITPPSEPKERE